MYRKLAGTWTWVAPLPYVLHRLSSSRQAATRSLSYRLAMSPADDDAAVVCDTDEIKDGTWAERLSMPLSAERKTIDAAATAIFYAAQEAPCEEMVSAWADNGKLHLPPAGFGPSGYGQTTGDEEPAQAVWREIAGLAGQAPKLALTVGAAFGGPYLAPLGRQPFWLLLTGAGGMGKTTALRLAASLYGTPEHVARPWNTSSIGIVQYLGTLGVLPALFDEFGAAGLPPARIEQLVFQTTEGAQRLVGGKTGTPRTSRGWNGVLLASGNDSILGGVSNEGVARRVLEVAAPITTDAKQAEHLTELIEVGVGAGWPVTWLQRDGLGTAAFTMEILNAERDIDLPDAAVPRSLGKHLALAIAGAGELDRLLGTTSLRPAALTAARELLDQMVREINERGISPGERVLSAVSEALAARPTAFPTRARYVETLSGGFSPSKDTEGWLLSQDDTTPGDVAVLTNRLDEICAAAGITNPRVGLRQLADQKVLLAGEESDGRLRRRLRVTEGRRTAVYVFQLPDDDTTGDTPGQPEPGPGAGDTLNSPVTCENAVQELPTGVSPVSPVSPPTGDRTGDTPDKPVTCENADSETSDRGGVPGVPGPGDRSRTYAREGEEDTDQDVVVVGLAGPVRRTGRAPAPCRVCGRTSVKFTDAQGPVHPACATKTTPEPTAEAPQPEPAQPATQGKGSSVRTRPRLTLCGVLDSGGLWLPGRDEPLPVELPTSVDAAYELAISHNLRQLWIHPHAHEQLGVPSQRPVADNPAKPFTDPWADSDKLQLDPAGLAAWVNVGPGHGEGRRVGLSFPSYDRNRTSWYQTESGAELRDAVLTFADQLKEPFYFAVNETAAAVLRKTATADLTEVTLPEPAGQRIAQLHLWSRAVVDEEDSDDAIVHRYDLNGAQSTVFGAIHVGIGDPIHLHRPTFDLKRDKNRPGYWLAQPPAPGHGLDLRLPDLLKPWHDAHNGPAWITTDTLTLLAELGATPDVEQAWVWPQARRLLRPAYERYRKARTALIDQRSTPAGDVAYQTLKSCFTSVIGYLAMDGTRIYRPDIRDTIISRAHANQYRRSRAIGEQSGRYPIALYEDALYYVAHTSDPAQAAPRGMPLGAKLGQYKYEASAPLSAVRDHGGSKSFRRAFNRAAWQG